MQELECRRRKLCEFSEVELTFVKFSSGFGRGLVPGEGDNLCLTYRFIVALIRVAFACSPLNAIFRPSNFCSSVGVLVRFLIRLPCRCTTLAAAFWADRS